jgi:hypothetical protein
MEVIHVEVAEAFNDFHDVPFYDIPTPLEENPGKAIGPGALSLGI